MRTPDRLLVSRDVRWAIEIGFACVIVAIAVVTYADADLWGHTRFGLDILSTHTVPLVDKYSFTQDRPQIYHEWLGAVITAAAYAQGGSTGLEALKLAITAAVFFAIVGALRMLHPVIAGLLAVFVAWNMVPLT